MLRLQVTVAPHNLLFTDQDVMPGDRVLKIHLWNEQIPFPASSEGSNLSWAIRLQKAFLKSLRAVSRYIQETPGMADIRAVGGETILLWAGDRQSGERFIRRLGFKVMPYVHPLGRFGEFWENFYSWVLIWTYNPASLHHRNPFQQRRFEFWMTTGDFLARYGKETDCLDGEKGPS